MNSSTWSNTYERLKRFFVADPNDTQIELVALEDRVLYSAAPIDASVDLSVVEVEDVGNLFEVDQATDEVASVLDIAEDNLDFSYSNESPTEPPAISEVVLVDQSVEDFETLVASLNTETTAVHIIDSSQNGIEQISAILQSYDNLDAIHIVSHGNGESFQVGSSVIDNQSLMAYSGQLALWQDSLSVDADLLIYGCDLASTTDGQELLEAISAICECDVAASDDLTGHSDLGGDWIFEYVIGSVDTDVAFSIDVQQNWHGTLDITSGLVGHFEFEEGSGTTATDSSVTGNDGVLTNSPTYVGSGAIGSDALDFTGDGVGANATVQVPANVAYDFDNDFSVSFWYNTSGTQSNNTRIVSSHDGSTGFWVETNNSGNIGFGIEGSTGVTLALSGPTFYPDGNWHHITATREGTTTSLLVDGYEVATSVTTGIGTVSSAAPLTIGGVSSVASDYEGQLDDVRIYSRSLSSDDVLELVDLGPTEQPLGYAYAYGQDNSLEWITNVSYGDINNTTAQESGGYENYTSNIATVSRGDSNDLSVSIQYDLNVSGQPEEIRGWIDWNQDGDFEDTGEEVYSLQAFTDGPHVLSVSTPVGASLGETVLRVAVKFDGVPESDEFLDFGEVEDYSVFVLPGAPTTFTVVNTNDSGIGSLRQAIINANANAGLDTIEFDIPGSGTQEILLSSVLPQITEGVFIDGTSQTDWVAGSFLPIVVDGSGLVGSGLSFSATADDSEVRGLVVRDFSGNAITADAGNERLTIAGNFLGAFDSSGAEDASQWISSSAIVYLEGDDATIGLTSGGTLIEDRNIIAGGDNGIVISGGTNNTVAGNYIGTDLTGNISVGMLFDGIRIENGGTSNTIGGATTDDGNLIASVDQDGIHVDGETSDSNTIQNNTIGVSADGTQNFGVGANGILLTGGSDGTNILSNVIASAQSSGIEIDGASDLTSILGNFIGTDLNEVYNWGTSGAGILIESGATNTTVGGILAGQGNVIANSGQSSTSAGVLIIDSATGNSVRGNSIYRSSGIGIDLAGVSADGADENDSPDIDSGGNNKQNWAILTSASIADDGTFAYEIDTTTLDSGTYTIDFYSSSDRDAGSVEGETFIGSVTGIVDGNSSLGGTISSVTLATGQYITSTITDASGNTSEFSNYTVSVDADAGGTAPSDLLTTSTIAGGLSINEGSGDDVYLLADDGSSVFGSLTDLTIEARLTLDASPSFPHIVDYAIDGQPSEFSLSINNDKVQVDIGGTTYLFTDDFAQLRDGEPHTISVVWDGTVDDELTLYIDGALEETLTGIGDHTLSSGGTLVIGNDQDSVGNDFQTDQALKGTLFDIRVFDQERNASQILASYRSTLPVSENGMVANWRFDDLSSDSIVTEAVSGNNLAVRHILESGFTAGEVELTFGVDENALVGTVVGTVQGIDAEREALISTLLSSDPELHYSAETGKFYKVSTPNTIWSTANTLALGTDLNGIAGELATIRSATEDAIIGGFAQEAGKDLWLGGSDEATEGVWYWQDSGIDADQFWLGGSDGSSINDSYTEWLTNRPDNSGGGQHNLLIQSGGTWNDEDSAHNAGYIVQWDADEVLDNISGSGSVGQQALTYSIVSQTVAGAFTIDSQTGEISVADNSLVDHESNSSHSVTVRVTDVDFVDVTNETKFEETFTISINDLDESNNSPVELTSGIEFNTDGGNDAYLFTSDGDSILGLASKLTYEVSFSTTDQTNDLTLLSYRTSADVGVDDDSRLIIQSDGSLSFNVSGTGSDLSTFDFNTLRDGELHSLAWSWDNVNGDYAVYVDGVLVESGVSAATAGAEFRADGTLVIGQEQDSVDGNYDSGETFSGTLYDVRVWNEVRSAAEIELNYQHKFAAGNLPDGLVANWQMDGFDGSSNVVDIVASRDLSIGHATDSGFSTSEPVEELNVDENVASGTSVGYVIPTELDTQNDIVDDGLFLNSPTTGRFAETETFGSWTVLSGDIDFQSTPTPEGGRAIELSGLVPGAIGQDLTTVEGRQYQVLFSMSGSFSSGEAVKDLRVGAGGISEDFSMEEPPGWTIGDNVWDQRSFTFTADSTNTQLSFASLNSDDYGPHIADIRVIEIPTAVTTILTNDPTLTYDAGTGKFYQVVTTGNVYDTATTNANNSLINGVGGQLVTIRSAYEDRLIQRLIQDTGVSEYYISGTDAGTEGQWNWIEDGEEADRFWNGAVGGSAPAGAYAKFSGEPGGSTAENYLAIRTSDGVWLDISGTGPTRGSIVEWDASEVLSNFTFSMTDVDNRFTIDSDTGEISVLDGSLVDFESNSSHDVSVDVTDASGNTLSETVTITVNNLGGEPMQTVPGAQVVAEDGTLTFSVADFNPVSVTDTLSSSDSLLQVSLSVNDGVLTLSQVVGLTFVEGSNASSQFVINGTESDINAALEEMTFDPDADFNGAVTLNMSTSLGVNLEGLYDFEDGTASDQSAGATSEDGFTNGDPTIDDIGGDRGHVLTLDGTGDSVEITGTYSNPSDVTLAAWINTSGGGNREIVSLGDNFAIRVRNDGTLTAFYYDAGGLNFADTNVVVTGDWTHVAATFSDTDSLLTIYINGEAVHSEAANDPIVYARGSNTFIGAHGFGSGSFDFNGEIDDARVYSRVLESDEVAALATNQAITEGTVAITVTADNDAPVLTSGAGGGTHNEGSSGTFFNNSLTLTDIDSPDFDGGVLTTTITNNGESGDRLFVLDGNDVAVSGSDITYDFGGGPVIVGSFTGGDGTNALVITFNGSSDPTSVEAVAQQVAYRTEIEDPSGLQRTLQMQVTDGDGGTSSIATRTMNVIPHNDAPVLDLDLDDSSGSTGLDFNQSFLEEGGAVFLVDTDASLTDVDSSSLTSIIVTLTNEQEGGNKESLLADTTGTTLNAVWDTNVDTLTISGTGTVADFETVLGTVQYDNTSKNPNTSVDRIITFVANDGTDDSLIATTTLSVTDVNNAPETDDVVGAGNEDDASIPITLTGTDVDGTVQSFALSSLPANGNLYIDAGLTTLAATATNYAATANSLTLYFEPNADWNGSTNFLYAATDNFGLVDATDNLATINVTAVNDAPVIATNNTLTLDEGDTGSVVTTLLLNEGDVDDDATEITYRVTTLATEGTLRVNGTAVIVNGTFTQDDIDNNLVTYDHLGGEASTDSFVFDLLDGGEDSAAPLLNQTFNIAINPINDQPILVNNSLTIIEGGTVTLGSGDISATDADNVDGSLTFTVSSVTGGIFAYATDDQIEITSFLQSEVASGDVVFVHDSGESAPTFDVEVSDGALTDSGSASITFTNINDAPVIKSLGGDSSAAPNDATVVLLDNGIAASLSDSDSPADYDNAVLTIAGNSFDGSDSLGIDTSGTINLVSGLNVGSVVQVSGTNVGVLAAVTNDSITINFTALSTVSDVELILQSLTFESTSTTLGLRTVDMTFNDGDGTANGGSDTSTVVTASIVVTDASGGSVSTDEDITYTFVATDFDFTGTTGSNLNSITIVSLPANGSLELNGSAVSINDQILKSEIDSGLLEFVPVADENGVAYASFTFEVNNGNASVNILAGETNQYTLSGGQLLDTDAILADVSNFGVGGTVPTSVSVVPSTTTVDAAYLAQGEIFFNGYVPDGSYTPAELSALDSWVSGGGILISTSDHTSYDDVNAFYGLTTVNSGNVSWLVDDATNEIMNGPFGLVGNNGDAFSAAGSIGYFSSASLDPGDVVLAIDSISLEPTMVLRAQGSGYILFTSDEGIFRANTTGGGTVSTPNDILAANIFAWAIGQVPSAQTHSMNVNVDAVNDDPTNAGSLPATVTATEDISSDVDISAIDLSDVDSATGDLTITLTTGAGSGTLSAVTGGGVTVGGSGTATLTLTGTESDLNTFLNTASNVQYLSSLNTNGTAADSIQVDVTDNGNVGSGGGGTINFGTVSVDISAENDDPTNAGSLPPAATVTEDVATDVDFSSINLSDVDSATGDLTMTFSTGSGGTLTAVASGGVVVGGSGTATLTLTGTESELNTFLDVATNIQFLSSLNANGTAADSIQVDVTDNGNVGNGGGGTINLGTTTIDIDAVNDDPTNAGSLPATVTATEDISSDVDISAIDLSDVDSATGDLTITLTTGAGSGTLSAVTGGGVTVGGSGTATLTLTGTESDLNTFLNTASNVQYLSSLNTNGTAADSIQVDVTDNGNVGSGGGGTINFGTVSVDISAENDDPTNAGSLPATATVTEDVATDVDFSSIDLSDVDSATGDLTMTFSTGSGGTLTAVASGGVVVGGSGTATLTLTGTESELNTFLDVATNIQFLSSLNANGTAADSIQVNVTDNGNVGNGGGGTINLGTTTIDIDAVNDDPTNAGSFPATVTATEDISSDVDISVIDLSDVDSATGDLTITLTTGAGSGTLSAVTGGGVTVGGSGTATLTLTGTESDLNTFLNTASNVQYLSSLNTNGTAADSIQVDVTDNGNVGSGGGGTINFGTVSVDISAENDDPTNAGSLPAAATVTEDVATDVDFSSINLSDVDSATGDLTMTFSTGSGGTLTAVASGGVVVGGSGTATLTLTGTESELNTFLDVATNIQFLSSLNANGTAADSIQVDVTDNGNVGNGGGGTINLGTTTIDIDAVNDDPTNAGSLPATVTVAEDISSDVDISVIDLSDVDSATGDLTITLTTGAGSGTLSAVTGGGVTVGGSGTATLTLTGTESDLNTFLNTASNVQYLSSLNTNGTAADSIQVDVTDNGNVGSGGGGTINFGTVSVDISAENDDPTNAGSLPAAATVTEDVATDVDFSSIDLSDVDSATGDLTMTFSTGSGGTLTAVASGGVVVGGSGTATLTLTGTESELNTFLDVATNIQFLSSLNANGTAADSIQVDVTDNGNVGNGGGGTINLGTTTIDIDAVNDDPTNAGSLPATVTVAEDISSDVDISAIDLSDVDSATGDLTITLTTGAGSGTLSAVTGGGVTVGGSGTATLTLTGTESDLNTFLNTASNVQYLSSLNTNGTAADSIQVDVTDNGNVGSGGGGTINFGTVSVDISAENDDPTNAGSLPAAATVTEDVATDVDFSSINLSDVDSATGDLTMTFSTGSGGTLTAVASGGVVVGGSGTATLTLTGTESELNTFLDVATNIQFLSSLNANGTAADSIQVDVTDNGNVGNGGGGTINLGTTTIDIDAVNDDPTNAGSLPATVTVAEDISSDVDISVIDLSDVDSATGDLTITLTTGAGSGTLSAVTGGGVSVGGSGTATLTLTGTESDLNTFLNTASNVQYLSSLNTNGTAADSIQVDVTDNGNVGSGGGGTINFGTVSVDISAENDDPTNAGSLPPSATVTEDVATDVDFSSIDLSDVDSATGDLTMTFSTGSGGTLTAVASGGVVVGGSGTATLTLTGTESELNTFLDVATNIQFLSSLNANGTAADSIQVDVTDNGNVGNGGGGTINLGTTTIDIDAVNDDPTNAGSLPATVTATEDISSDVDISAIDLSDVDSATGDLTITLTTGAGSGTLSAVTGGGVTVGGSGTATLTLTGTESDLNTFLNTASNVQYLSSLNTNGTAADSIQVDVTDNGNVGSGGGGTINFGTVSVDISAENDDPTNAGSLPPSATVTEDVATDVDFSSINLSDVDSATGDLTMTFSTGSGGTLTAVASGGVVVGGSGTATLTLTGTESELNTFLDVATNIQFLSSLNANGTAADSIQVDVTDNGNVGNGGGGTINLGTTTIDIDAVNDDPTNAGSSPATVTATEDISSDVDISAIDLSDVDSATGDLTITLTTGAGSGTLSAVTGGGVTVGGSGTATLTLTGTESDLNTFLNTASNVQYLSSLNTNGTAADSIQVDVTDNGNVGSGGGGTINFGTVSVDVLAGNDAPVLDNSGTILFTSITEDEINNAGDLVSDLISRGAGGDPIFDEEGDPEGIAVNGITVAGNGTWEYSLDNGTTWSELGSVSDTNALLLVGTDRLRFVPDQIDADNSTISFRAWDQTSGSSGNKVDVSSNGGVTAFSTAQETASIVVTAINDAPVIRGTDLILNGDFSSGLTNWTTSGTVTSDGSPESARFGEGDVATDGVLSQTFATVIGQRYEVSFEYGDDRTTADQDMQVTVDGSTEVLRADVNSGVVNNQNGEYVYTFIADSTSSTISFTDTSAVSAGVDGFVDNVRIYELPNVTFTENGSAVVIDSGLLLSDVDDTHLTSASVQITGNFTTGEDQLNFTNQLGITGTYDSSTGILSLLGSATVADYQAAMRTITFENTSENSDGLDRTISWSVDDGSLSSQSRDSIAQVVQVNDDPFVSASLPSSVTVVEDITTDIDLGSVTFDDLDDRGGNMTVVLSAGSGTLNAVSSGGVIVSNSGTSTVTLDGTLSALNGFFDVSTNISYLGSLNNAGLAADSIAVTINDNGNTGTGGGTNVAVGTVTVDITEVNDDPTNAGGLPTDISVNEDVAGDVDLSAIDLSDVDSASGNLTVRLTTSALGTLSATSSGGVVVTGSGTTDLLLTGTQTALNTFLDNASNIQFLSSLNVNGNDADTIQVRVSDLGNVGLGGGGTIDFGTVNVDIAAVNDAPVMASFDPVMPTITEDQTNNSGSLISALLGSSVSDVDAAAIEGIAITALNSSNGTWQFSLDGTNWTDVGSVSDSAALLLRESDFVRFVPDAQNDDTASFDFRAWDQTSGTAGTTTDVSTNGGTTAFSTLTERVDISVTAVNDAPVLAPASPNLTSIGEDDTNNVGNQVSDFAASSISDVDNGSIYGIAITSLNSGNGTWQFSDDGTTWTDVGTVSDSSSLLLRSTDFVRFVPDGENSDTASISYRAWDQTVGTFGNKVDSSTNGGVTEFSAASDTATISVTDVNDAPVLSVSSPTLTTITEDDTNNGGNLISSVLGVSVSDADAGAIEGLAITSLNSGNGTWQFSLDGTNWNNVGAVSETSALLLRAGDHIRFVPDGLNSDSPSFDFRAWDQTSGTAGVKADVSTNGGTSAFSSISDTASLTVTDVNDAPVLTPSLPTLNSITEDEVNNAGQLVSTMLGASVNDVDNSALSGIAITNRSVTNGEWQYSLDGINWVGFGAVSPSASLLLSSTDFVRFVPDGENAESASFDFRAWDQTVGSSGTKVDSSVTGGTSEFSSQLDTASISITAVNDAPVLSAVGPTLTTITEDDAGNNGDLISSILGLSVSDVDNSPIEGIAVTSLNSGNGTWQYTLDGTNWNDVAAVSETSALLLRSTDRIRFVPDGENNDSASFDFRAWDQSTDSAGDKVDVSTNGGTTAFSTDSDTASIVVTDVNDAPVLAASSPLLTSIDEDDISNSGDQIASLLGVSVSDVDNASVEGIAITSLTSSNGTWQFSLDGTNWLDVGVVSDSNSLLLKSTDFIRFVPDQLNADLASFEFRAWDQTVGTAGTKVDSTINGGVSEFSSATDVATIVVTAVNDAPVVNDATFSVDENTSNGSLVGTVIFSDVDIGDSQVFTIIGGDPNNAFSINSSGEVRVANSLFLDFETTPVFNLTVQVSDAGVPTLTDTAAVTINLNDINEAPVGSTDAYSIDEGDTLNVASPGVLANDTDQDGDALTSSLVSSPAFGSISLNSDGSFSYTHDGSETTADSFTYRVSDGFLTHDVVVNLVINPVNDAPTIQLSSSPFTNTYVEDSPGVAIANAISLDIGDADNTHLQELKVEITNLLDGSDEVLTVDTSGTGIVATYSNGVLTLSGNDTIENYEQALRTIEYSNASQNPNETNRVLEVTVDDGLLLSTKATATISVVRVNDAPVGVDDLFSTLASKALLVDEPGVLQNDFDYEGDAISVSLLTQPQKGLVILDSDGSFIYIPNITASGIDSFTYVATDGLLNSTVVTVDVKVVGVGTANSSDGEGGVSENTITENNLDEKGEVLHALNTLNQIQTVTTIEREEVVHRDISQTSTLGFEERRQVRRIEELETIEIESKWAKSLLFEFGDYADYANMNQLDGTDELIVMAYNNHLIGKMLDQLTTDLSNENYDSMAAGTATGLTVAFSAGYLLWTLRGTYLLAMMFSSMPSWQSIDPLPILQSANSGGKSGKGTSLIDQIRND